jgi:hypothetical protein
MRIDPHVLAPALALGMAAAFGAQGDPQETTPAARYRALVREYQDAQQAYSRASAEAGTGQAGHKLPPRKPDPRDFARRFLDLAREKPGDRASFDALSWVLSHGSQGAEADQAYELLGASHLGDQRLAPILQHLSTSKSPAAEKLLRVALDKSPEPEIQAHACYSLALMLSARQRHPAAARRRGGRPAVAVEKPGQSEQDEKIREEVELLYGRLATEFHNVKFSRKKTFGEVARAALEKLGPTAGRQGTGSSASGDTTPASGIGLEIGMVAPEIEGVNTRGQPMRLSDFRGKVVVLDFWGHW